MFGCHLAASLTNTRELILAASAIRVNTVVDWGFGFSAYWLRGKVVPKTRCGDHIRIAIAEPAASEKLGYMDLRVILNDHMYASINFTQPQRPCTSNTGLTTESKSNQ